MKTTCFFNSTSTWGGGEKLHFEFGLEFYNHGHNVFVVAQNNSLYSERSKDANLQVFNIKIGNLSFLNPFKYLKLIQFYKKNKIDTVIFSIPQDLKIGGLAAKLAGVKQIVYLRGLAVPIKNSFLNRFLFKKVLTHIIANSEETKRKILQNLQADIKPEKVAVIYHGIDTELVVNKTLQILPEIKEQANGIILGNAGRLTYQKGQIYLIELAKILKARNLNFTLFIAGTGELQVELQTKIQAYHLEKEVILLGFVKKPEIFMYSIDIFLLSSIWEGFGFVIAEAMLHKKPVIGFDISSNPELIAHKKTGYLVEYPDIKKFADRVEELAQNTNLRKLMGENAFESVNKRFKLSDAYENLEQYLCS